MTRTDQNSHSDLTTRDSDFSGPFFLEKKCTNPRCGKVKLLTDFDVNRTKKDGRDSHCKDCVSKRKKQRAKAVAARKRNIEMEGMTIMEAPCLDILSDYSALFEIIESFCLEALAKDEA